MRAWELTLIASLALSAAILWAAPRRRPRWSSILPGASVLAAVIQLAAEGYRWQMVPIYLLAAAFASFPTLFRRRSAEAAGPRGGRTWLRGMAAWAGLVLLGAAVLATTLFPHLRLPAPSGPYAVGTTRHYFVDASRPETFTPDPDDHREISLRIWYPASRPLSGEAVSYSENAREVGRALTRSTPAPSFLFDHLALVRAHSYRDAGVPEHPDGLPIVLFNHAYWAGMTQSTALMEDLASHGYVIVSIGHAHVDDHVHDHGGYWAIRDAMPVSRQEEISICRKCRLSVLSPSWKAGSRM
jgi:predicted dienelactone hydrolase